MRPVRPEHTLVDFLAGEVEQSPCGTGWVGAGRAWTLRLTASVEGSPRPADGRDVLATRAVKHLGTDGVRRSRTAIRKDCACSKNLRLEKRMWWQESFAEGMVFTKAQPAAD
jgi:hypothetical protein